nr:hypothetical protein [Tanacetum cinerariifolium]
ARERAGGGRRKLHVHRFGGSQLGSRVAYRGGVGYVILRDGKRPHSGEGSGRRQVGPRQGVGLGRRGSVDVLACKSQRVRRSRNGRRSGRDIIPVQREVIDSRRRAVAAATAAVQGRNANPDGAGIIIE